MAAFDDDAFDDAFDFDDEFLDAADHGDGAPANRPAEAADLLHRQRRIRALVQHETGVHFDALAAYAAPLFDLYGLDAREAALLKTSPDDADEATLAVLETARVLWAYFALPARDRQRHLARLGQYVLGSEPDPDDWLDFQGLLEEMEPPFRSLTAKQRAAAEAVEAPTLDFRALLDHPAFRAGDGSDEETAGPRFGPNHLNEMEARALFAQPLLDEAARHGDADAFEAAMERAHAYWSVAQQTPEDHPALLATLARQFAPSRAEVDALRAEGERMLQRFYQLFPERRTRH